MRAEAPSLPAAPPRHETGSESHSHRRTVFKVFAAIVVVTFLLRIFYAGHLYQDDGLWFTAAEELRRGKVLYRDIYFDKPPAIALIYAALFKLFGAHILTIRLFTIVYAIAVSATLYVFGRRFYGERIGRIAAAMFAVFSTIYATGHVQGLNTDFLMVLPHTAAAYWLLCSRDDVFGRRTTPRQRARLAVAGGACVGVAMQINPKGVFVFLFFALLLLLIHFCKWGGGARPRRLWVLSVVGFVAGTLPIIIYLAATHTLKFYWLYVWDWGGRYARYYPALQMIETGVGQTVNYFLLNNTLLITLLFVATTVCRRMKRNAAVGAQAADAGDCVTDAAFRADVALLLWFAVSFLGMSVGGRFYGHYFFQVLPALCLIGGRGLNGILAAFKAKRHRWPRFLLALLVVGFAVTLVRFHTRTVLLAAAWLRGTPNQAADEWFHGRLKDEERQVAAVVRNLDMEPAEAARQLGAEAMRRGGPRERPPQGPSDYLFVWGYRPEVYYWSGLLPASKYLSTQPLTGVPGDAHYHSVHYHTVLDERDTAAARRELAEELARVQPEYIIDELGFFNNNLAMPRYAEFDEVLSRYKRLGTVKRFIVYRRRDLIKAGKREKQIEEERDKDGAEGGETNK